MAFPVTPISPLPRQLRQTTLQRKQPPLVPEAAGKSSQSSVAGHDAMAGDDDRNGIGPERQADRPGIPSTSDTFSDPLVRPNATIRYSENGTPDAALKGRAG